MVKAAGKREALSRERILRAALEIVDREGLDAISMRRLGEELGVEAMSLYHHVANKAAILDGIFETVLAELPPLSRSASWRTVLSQRARGLRLVLRAHPHALPIFATRPAATEASILHVEVVLDALMKGGFSAEDALSALQVTAAFVVGHTVAAYAPVRADETSRAVYDHLSEERFPRVREVARILPRHDLEKEFELGLEAMIVGIEARLERKPKR
ncbi:MAG: TetR family transcriptional regulator [Polyangiaceae bacterium]|nr:TetR family transcriptional regulator [Polyangiaceae bacterium]